MRKGRTRVKGGEEEERERDEASQRRERIQRDMEENRVKVVKKPRRF